MYQRIRLLSILICYCLFFISCNKDNNKLPLIGIVQITEDPVLDIARNALLKELQNSGFVDGENIRIDYKNAQGDISNIQLILKSFKNEGASLIITNSTPCMSAAASNIKEIPVVFTVSFGPEQLGIIPPDNLFGVFDPLKMDNFVELIQKCIPDLKVIGLPYNPSEPNAELSAKNLIESCKSKGIEVKLKPVNSPNDILPAIQSLYQEGIEVFVGAADNTIYLGLETIGKFASEHKIPLFVTDPMQANKGAAIGFGMNYEEWGTESAKLAVKILKKEKIEKNIFPLDNYQIIINSGAAKRQGLKIPEDLVNSASKIID